MIRRFGSWLGWLLVGTVVLVVMVWALGAWSGVILLYVWAAAVRRVWRWLDVLVVGDGRDIHREVYPYPRPPYVYRGLRGGGGNGGSVGNLPAYRVGPGVGEAVGPTGELEEGDGEPCEH